MSNKLKLERAALHRQKHRLAMRVAYLQRLTCRLPYHGDLNEEPLDVHQAAAKVLIDRAKFGLDVHDKERELLRLQVAIADTHSEIADLEGRAASLKVRVVSLGDARERAASELAFMRVGLEMRTPEVQRLLNEIADVPLEELRREDNAMWARVSAELTTAREELAAVNARLSSVNTELTACPQDEPE